MVWPEIRLSPRRQRILERLASTDDPAAAQRLSQLLLLLEEESRRDGRNELETPDTDEVA